MAGAVVVWLGAFAKSGQPEAAQATAEAEAAQRHHGDDGVGAVASVKKGEVQEKRTRNSGVLSDSGTVVCMLTDRFAPA
ncbi:unnamed protein product [Miscanthus lutarioriparius]|uniref:Uncharacterized protein n=1 Tax=Miscanthus lutarioriparius TaxID=422564 RepID=A0A811MMH4_9POAL|nr:unnamed protein product [Miscanthus lutarioriparius]